jgi:hypothetical protein
MNKLLCILSYLCFTSISAHAADDAGWNNAKWGMTSEQIIQIYPEARALAKPEKYEQVGEIFNAVLGIERFELATQIYRIRFLMDAKNVLGGVILAHDDQFKMTVEQATLENLLTQKYGSPSFAEDTRDGGRSVTWTSKGVTITLNNISVPRIDLYGIRLIYLRPNTKSLDKL